LKETLSIFITVIILVLLIVIFPLYNYFERQDDMSYNLVLKSTTEFVDEIINSGYISQDMYTDYIVQLANTGNLYDIELEAHRKVLVRLKDGSGNYKDEYEEQYLIDYNDDIFDTTVTNPSNIDDRVIKNGVYRLNVGDKVFIKLKNSSTTMAGALFNIIVPTSSTETIKINYGGIIQNNIWKQADRPLITEREIKLTFDLNTKGDNNAIYNNSIIENGMVGTLYTGSRSVEFTIPNANPIRQNALFQGWSDNPNDTRAKYIPGNTLEIDESLTLYAIWAYRDITLTLDPNGGTLANTSRILKYGNAYTTLATDSTPTRSGYDFEGWYTAVNGGTKVTKDTMVESTRNVTLYAHWKESLKNMTITFNANGGNVVPSSTTGEYEQYYVYLPNPKKDGYIFKGWYTEDTFVNRVTPSTKITNINDHSLYAKWVVAEASIGSDYYETLESAIANATSTNTVKLLADITRNSTISISKSVKLDLNSKTITNNSTTDMFSFSGNGTIQLKNGYLKKSNAGRVIYMASAINVTIENLNINSTSSQYTIYLANSTGNLKISGCVIESNMSVIISTSATATPNIHITTGNFVSKEDRVIYLANGTLTLGVNDTNLIREQLKLYSTGNQSYPLNMYLGNNVIFNFYDGTLYFKDEYTFPTNTNLPVGFRITNNTSTGEEFKYRYYLTN